MNKIIVIVGPTAVGKTDLSIALAKKLNTEIISADSVQIYEGLDIGSAKPSSDEMQGVRHHMISCVKATAPYSVSDFESSASKWIDRLHAEGKIPVIVGGTGLYVNSLLYEMNFGQSCADEAFRIKMEQLAERDGKEAVHALLKAVDPVAAERIHANNLKRVIRALEINHVTGNPTSDFASEPEKTQKYEVILIGLTRPREVLYERINRRVEMMVDAGLIDEVKKLKNSGLDDSFQSMQGIGYKEVLNYIDGISTYEQMKDAVKQASRNYAKRQMTWFKRYAEIRWIDLEISTTESALESILSLI
ncbi:MAG TPA: tRNA (adenosine(37)-N6)-dimethylallyltransferase MiaA [Clostridiales bacterium UBA8960]|jgi:tRNA dimethylallyltransferase|nr:tRNA (adenosine(37)-N6)-dimethylallyltransferase MiaA [Clostridiales bacterium UBA8960]